MSVPKPTHSRFVDLEGRQFGHLFVVEYAGLSDAAGIPGDYVETAWLCRCDCGNTKVIRGKALRLGKITSCRRCQGDGPPLPDDARPIPSAPGYRVRNGGEVWTCWSTRGEMTGHWRVLKPRQPDVDGYIRIELRVGHEPWIPAVHQLVLEALVGPCPPGHEGCHNDGDPSNNFVSNLRWDTTENNFADRDRHGRTARGMKSGLSKLSDDEILDIFRMANQGISQGEIASRYGISQTNVSQILLRNTWKHIEVDDSSIVSKGQVKGERHGKSKLTERDIVAIFERFRDGTSRAELARQFGVSRSSISFILNRKTWSHVPIPPDLLPQRP